jgi:hypothetical protein
MDISIYSVHIGAESEVIFPISQLLPTSNASSSDRSIMKLGAPPFEGQSLKRILTLECI